MLTLQNILNLFSDKEIYDSLIHIMENYFRDFSEVQKKYLQAMDTLEKDLGEAAITKEKEAIRQGIASTLFFSGWLGLQANLNYYLDPTAGNFLNTEPELYLQEKASRKLPAYETAQEIRKQFYAGLTDAQRLIYEDVTEYICYLETAGPKLAHYYGYLLGNAMLHRVVPGYQPDMALTLRYAMMLENHFGADFDWNFLLKASFSMVEGSL